GHTNLPAPQGRRERRSSDLAVLQLSLVHQVSAERGAFDRPTEVAACDNRAARRASGMPSCGIIPRGGRFSIVRVADISGPARVDLARIGSIGRSLLSLNRGREYRNLLRMLRIRPDDAVLDVGSGDGFWTSRFADHCGQMVGIEPDQRMLALA